MRLISCRRGRRDGIGVMVDDTRFISLATVAPVSMKPGDTVEVEITGLGIARNPIVAEK